MSSNNANRRVGRGRQRIPLSRIESDTSRSVAFSKRRNGLIKKANEISTLCGVEILLVIFSPSGKAYTFSNPGMDAILTKYFGANPTAQPYPAEQVPAEQNLRAHREALMQIMSSQINYLEMQIEEEIKVNKVLREAEKVNPPISELPLSELPSMKHKMEMLRDLVLQKLLQVPGQAHLDTSSLFGYSQFGANDNVGPSGGASAQ
ncbi:PREDICTED: agamous-like MADS-box protein AGL62 [Ipomoea nil]|uniref:agamous-like MADS-box protein AGL62 n=1 Tax=Ipomoea nil TaxID=35883 RepID=UPI00090113A0|nr:PREDICTED: agamous-like MADS-box protein AGL62 [Ipomoea nil]